MTLISADFADLKIRNYSPVTTFVAIAIICPIAIYYFVARTFFFNAIANDRIAYWHFYPFLYYEWTNIIK